MLGEDKNRERFGRFPHPTGSTIQYVRENVRSVASNPMSCMRVLSHISIIYSLVVIPTKSVMSATWMEKPD